jgi:hypothetical protein
MAISNYTDLQAKVASWLGRTDMSEPIRDAIALAEEEIAATLRKQTVRAALTLDADEVDLPATCAELRSIRFDTDTRKYPITLMAHEALGTVRRGASGVPNYAAVVDGVLLLDITPDADYVTEITYYEALVPLSDDAPSNATLTGSSRIYLFGALKEMAPYLEHDARVPLWESKFAKAIDDENISRERAELGGAPKVIRLPYVFG